MDSEGAKPSRRNRVGMPASLWLHEFGSQVWAAFGEPPYLVGSALVGEREPHDVDVRLILSDEEYEALGLGDPRRPHSNAKWVSLVLAYSALGRQMTGLPIDFQIQRRTEANKDQGPRSALGLVPLRMRDSVEDAGASHDKARSLDALVAGIPMPSFDGTGWGWSCLPDTPRLTVAQHQRLAEWYGAHYAERFATAEAALLAAAEAAEIEERAP